MRVRTIAVAVLLMMMAACLPAAAQYDWGRARRPKAGACFYRGDRFHGDSFCLGVGDRWPELPSGFNDRIKSIRVFGGARVRVFNDSNFRGINLFIDGDVPDLRGIRVQNNYEKNWADRISSIAVFIPERDEWIERREEHRDDRREEHRDDWRDRR